MDREDSFNLAVRRMLRSSQVFFVLNVAYSEFSFIRSNLDLLRLLRNSTEDVVTFYGGTLFDMSGGDQFAVFPEAFANRVGEIADKITAAAFPDHKIDDTEDACLVRVFRIPDEYVALRQITNGYAERAGLAPAPAAKPVEPETDLAGLDGPLSPWSLARIERALAETDLAPFLRTQTVFQTDHRGTWTPLFTEHYTSIGDLRRQHFPKLALTPGDRLFQELCQVLDRRSVPEILRRHASGKAGRLSLNVGLATLLSPMFEKFRQSSRPESRPGLVLEINRSDLLHHPREAAKAIRMAREAGFEVALDGVTLDLLAITSLHRLEVDYIKLAMLKSHLSLLKTDECLSSLRRLPKDKIIVCRCEQEQNIAIGQAFGLTRFQGWQIDRLNGIEPQGVGRGAEDRADDAPPAV